MIESWHVREALRNRLGSSLVDEPGFPDPLADLLRSYASYKDTYVSLAARVEDLLFNLLYNRLGPSMTVQAYVLESGSFSAMRTLYTRYAEFMTEEERRLLARVIRDARPREYWSEWLSDEPQSSGNTLHRPAERSSFRIEDDE